MKRFRKISRKNKVAKIDKNELETFYKMLLKFEKRHPDFKAANVFSKLYPNTDFDSKGLV